MIKLYLENKVGAYGEKKRNEKKKDDANNSIVSKYFPICRKGFCCG